MAAAKPSPWIKGIVKEVPSGDTLVIASSPKLGAPEKRITLASLMAPRLGRRDGSTQDEPFAWQSREFLRKKCIGQTCTFRTDYKLANIPGREFGSVFIGPQSENVALSVVSKGWAKVRAGGGEQSPYIEQLTAASTTAEGEGLGIFSKDTANAVRDVPPATERGFATSFLEEKGKGKPLPGIVEQVGNGSMLRVTLLPDFHFVTVSVCGIQAPSMGRRTQPAAPVAAQEGEGAEPAAPAAMSPPEPFAREAKHLTESRVLNREVRIVLEGVDKYDNLFGSVKYVPSSGAEGAEAVDLGLQLVEAGYAKVVEWGLNFMVTGAQRLREAERKAKQQKIGMWHSYVPPASAGNKLSDNFTGNVVEIVSGDCLVVRDAASGLERRVTLSSIRAPRLRGPEGGPEPWAREAKEFLRARLIGKEVSVSMEYSRKVPYAGGEPGAEQERVLSFATVQVKEKVEGGQRVNNVAELLLQRGLASIVRHRTDDERSAHYEALLEAEQAGERNKKGQKGKKEPEPWKVNDVSLSGNSNKAKQFLPFLQRNKHNALVDFVLSGNRLKLYIEKEGALIAFAPSGVRTPQRPMPAGNGRPAAQAEPFWEEALAFTRNHCLQREVEIEVETMDRGGTFLGTLVVKGQKPLNLGLALLTHGLAKLQEHFDPDRVSGGRDLLAAQEKARAKRLKVWENYTPPEPVVNGDASEETPSSSDSDKQQIPVTVTDLISGGSVYLQADQARVKYIGEEMGRLSLSEASGPPPRLQNNALCVAQFSGDKQWYRARVEKADLSDPVGPKYSVRFIDFGNSETVKGSAVREIDPALAVIPPQAHLANLAYIKVKDPSEDETGHEAARRLNELVSSGQALVATVESGKLGSANPVQVVLAPADSSGVEESINGQLLAAGLARFVAPRRAQANKTMEALSAVEEAARKKHVGMWQYGDPGDESDEDENPKGAWFRR